MIQFYIPWEGEGEGGYDENLKYKHRTDFKQKYNPGLTVET
jgi:hypothetical protein